MNAAEIRHLIEIDREHIWHPYASMSHTPPVYPVASARGVRLTLADGRQLIDGMASWWCAIHGYNHPEMNRALQQQIDQLAHVMFGGLTHEPAVALTEKLLAITPAQLQQVFYSDSGSVAVEVALKMALQYWQTRNRPDKKRFLTIRGGYHGDTFGAMAVCDPVTGMHQLFGGALPQHLFAETPQCEFAHPWDEQDIGSLASLLEQHGDTIAAVIMEPIVQGAGGMRFYSPMYLKRTRQLCDAHGVLLILDEIATGFGRTGKLFACEHAAIAPDIMCLGKALTGGYMSFAATLCTSDVSATISSGDPGVFMHGPTFMGNPLACRAALTSIELLLDSGWQHKISAIETLLKEKLAPAAAIEHVENVRVLGAIGVIECARPIRMEAITREFVERGIWLRPFGKLVYAMPPYIVSARDLALLADTMVDVVAKPQFLT